MLSSSTTRRIVTAVLVAAAVGPLSAATASAATVTRSDDTAADFSAGTPSSTVVRADGAVELARTLEESFDGTVLPAGWVSTPWPAGGAATVTGGAMLVDGTRADSGVTAGPGSSIEFRATLGSQPYAHVGFATDFTVQPWAMFSTGSDGGGKVYARTSNGNTATAINFEVPLVSASESHAYRIDWTATGFVYYVDDMSVPVATHPIPLTDAMLAQASDFNPDAAGVSIESMVLNTHKPSGTFISRPLDGGDPRVSGLSFTATSTTPSGTAIAYETRTATSTEALASAPWAPLSASGAVMSPKARYLQYRANLDTTVATATPRLDKVDVAFTIDDEAPKVTINSAAVSAATAKVTFSSDDASAATTCKLDSKAFAACTSPAEYSDLAHGSHTIVVQATDAHGNVGSATRTFVVDTRAPAVSIGQVAVNGDSATVAFSSDDASAAIKCKLDGAAYAGCTSPAVFKNLASGAHTVVVQATDASGNVGSATRTFSVAPSAGNPYTPSGGDAADTTAPNVRVSRTVRVSKRGIAAVRVTCPQAEVRCRVTVKLKRGGKWIAGKTLTVSGYTTRTFALKLSKATRSKLARSRQAQGHRCGHGARRGRQRQDEAVSDDAARAVPLSLRWQTGAAADLPPRRRRGVASGRR